MVVKTFFHVLEGAAFILPAIPDSIWVRLSILSGYFVLHYFRVQVEYAKIKRDLIHWESINGQKVL